jgi:SAM-dependent methyltransferase
MMISAVFINVKPRSRELQLVGRRARHNKNFVPENPYDRVPYRTFPRRQTHPDRLASIGALFGMKPAPVTACRVLEIGCGDGGNLIPLAYALPRSSFVGIDLAEQPVAAARELARTLALDNVQLQVRDLREIGAADGEFDCILAHGLYSWIPAEIRDALLALCRERLSPHGVAFISYNAHPGQRDRLRLREMLLRHTTEVAAARAMLQALPDEEAALLTSCPDDILFHDILAPVNDAFYFHEFAAHAAQHGLRYLGEADPHEMFDENGVLQDEAGEQELDRHKHRRFRQTLLCRDDAAPQRRVSPRKMERFLFSENPHGRRISGADPAVESVAQALQDVHPLPVAFDDLIPYAGSRESLGEILLALIASGCADLHVHDFPCEESVSDRPCATRLARYQAATSPLVTNLCHMPVQLDEVARHLLLLLDGSRTENDVVRALSSIPGAGKVDEIRAALPASLHWLAEMALFER